MSDGYGPMRPELAKLVARAGQHAEYTVQRSSIQNARTFSEEAMNQLGQEMMLWTLSRIIRRWNDTDEPPTHVRVRIHVEVG